MPEAFCLLILQLLHREALPALAGQTWLHAALSASWHPSFSIVSGQHI